MFRLAIGAALMALLGLTSGCSIGIYDGMRVSDTDSSVSPWGYVTNAPASEDRVRIQAREASTGRWVTIQDDVGISSAVAWTMADGTELYRWDADSMTIPSAYWSPGTGGSYARLRVQWFSQGSWSKVNVVREDWMECMTEDFDGQGNTPSYVMEHCFSHRDEAYVYTSGYREGPSTCPAPDPSLPKTNGHYMIEQLPPCALDVVSKRMREKIDETTILLHYEINHNTTGSATKGTMGDDGNGMCSMQPGSDGQCNLGGFFGGHERYLRRMERHVMVYDYPWMPKGRLPAWDGGTSIPTQVQDPEVSPEGNCPSYAEGCDGWSSDPIVDDSPELIKPASVGPDAVCAFSNADEVADAVMSWHGMGHLLTGGYFAGFDSPAGPLFFLWHTAVNDVWVNYRNCD